jgi:hypothetical protein
MTRDAHAKSIFEQNFENIAKTHVLVVGAGGIGCELLKNLVLSGFKSILVIDLDTIDLSNLNRQFLFGKNHLKKSKAVVARESVLQMVRGGGSHSLSYVKLSIQFTLFDTHSSHKLCTDIQSGISLNPRILQ